MMHRKPLTIRFSKSIVRVMIASGFLMLLLAVLLLIPHGTFHTPNIAVHSMKSHLHLLRESINHYNENHGSYPESIKSLQQNEYNRETPQLPKRLAVNFTDLQKDVPEYRSLNGEGGYYYNPDTGDIRINLLNPVKFYLPSYDGEYMDDNPANW